MFTSAQLAAAVSPETAVVIQDYPYGFRLRCQMRVWVEFRKGKGFRYVTQTSNPKRPGTWNKPKAGTYSRVCMVITQDENGHLSHESLTEYSSLADYDAFAAAHASKLSADALGSLAFWNDIKGTYERKREELGVDNIYNATPEQRYQCQMAWSTEFARHVKAGTDY